MSGEAGTRGTYEQRVKWAKIKKASKAREKKTEIIVRNGEQIMVPVGVGSMGTNYMRELLKTAMRE